MKRAQETNLGDEIKENIMKRAQETNLEDESILSIH